MIAKINAFSVYDEMLRVMGQTGRRRQTIPGSWASSSKRAIADSDTPRRGAVPWRAGRQWPPVWTWQSRGRGGGREEKEKEQVVENDDKTKEN